MTFSSRRARKNAAVFALWTRLTALAVVGSYLLTWLLLFALAWLQS